MIYQRNFIKELSFTAVGIFVVLLAVLVSTQIINLPGCAAGGRAAVDAVAALVGFWVIDMTPLLLVLTVFINTLTTPTHYWRDSEVSVWFSYELTLKQWIRPVTQFAVSSALLIAVMQLWVMPWVELRSREYAEILKRKQELSLVEAGEFNSLGKRSDRAYFVETFDIESGIMKDLFLRGLDKNGSDNITFAKEDNFVLTDNKRMLELRNGYRYSGKPDRVDCNQVSFEHLSMIISTMPKIVDPIAHRRTIPTAKSFGSDNPRCQAELMWRLSFPISVLLPNMLAMPFSYFDPRAGHAYNIPIAIDTSLVYQNGLISLRDAVEDGKIHFWSGILPMHILMTVIAVASLRMHSMPMQPFWQAVGKSLTLKGGK